MRNLMLIFGLAMGLVPSAHALEIEVHPLALKAKVEVLGVRVGVDGKKAIIMTGKAAEEVAEYAGQAFDAAEDMLILTGEEVDEILDNALTVAANATDAVEDTVVIATSDLRDAAIHAAKKAADLGRYTWTVTKKAMSGLAAEVVEGLDEGIEHGVTFIHDAGVLFGDTAKDFLIGTGHFLCGFSNLFGIKACR